MTAEFAVILLVNTLFSSLAQSWCELARAGASTYLGRAAGAGPGLVPLDTATYALPLNQSTAV